MPPRANFLCRFILGLSGLVLFVGNISAQKVGDPVGHLPMKKYDDMTGALVTSGTIVALDRPGLRLFMKCDKPFWGPLRTGSDSVCTLAHCRATCSLGESSPDDDGWKKSAF